MGADRAKRKQRGGSIDLAWEEITRRKIQASQVLNRLIAYVNGEIKLEAAQVTAALGLVRKILPDLTHTEYTGEIEHRYVIEAPAQLSGEEWERKYSQTPVLQ